MNLDMNDPRSVSDRVHNRTMGKITPQFLIKQLLDKMSTISSTVERLNERMTSLESDRVKDANNNNNDGSNMAVEQEVTRGPESADFSDQLSIVVPQDQDMESCCPEILDPNNSHKVGNLTSKSLTHDHGHNNDITSPENNNDNGGKDLSEVEGQDNSAKHLPFDPVSEAPGWEPSPAFKEFLETNFRRSLSSSQIFSILEDTSLPDLEVFATPKLDKTIAD